MSAVRRLPRVLRIGAAGLACVLGLAAPGCATIPTTAPASVGPTTTTWDAARAEATRRVEVYDSLMRQADLRATLLTPRVRRAYIDERARFHGAFAARAQRDWLAMGEPDEGVDAPMRSGPPGDGEVLVFVAFYSPDPKTRSLSARTSIWDVALVRGATRVRPTRIEEVTASPAVSAMFPFVDRFDDLYLLHFPGSDTATGTATLAPGLVSLEVRSALAGCVVGWTLAE